MMSIALNQRLATVYPDLSYIDLFTLLAVVVQWVIIPGLGMTRLLPLAFWD